MRIQCLCILYNIHKYVYIHIYIYIIIIIYYIYVYIYTQYIGFCWENPALMENAGVFVIFKAEEWLFRLQLGLS